MFDDDYGREGKATCGELDFMALDDMKAEKTILIKQLYKRVTTQTAAVWAHTLVLRLLESLHQDSASENTPQFNHGFAIQQFKHSQRRLLMFDYGELHLKFIFPIAELNVTDGTLTPIVKVPSAAVPSESLLASLEKLASDPKNILYIISGRDGDFLMQHLGHIPNLGFSAEHGSFLKEPGQKEWKNLTEHIDMSWKADVEEIFRCKLHERAILGNTYEANRRLRGTDNRVFRRKEARQCDFPLSKCGSRVWRISSKGMSGSSRHHG